jgi:hypothetical protein
MAALAPEPSTDSLATFQPFPRIALPYDKAWLRSTCAILRTNKRPGYASQTTLERANCTCRGAVYASIILLSKWRGVSSSKISAWFRPGT